MKTSFFFLVCGLFVCNSLWSQKAVIQGVILDEEANPVSSAFIHSNTGESTESNINGFYRLELPAGVELVVTISHLGFKKITFSGVLEEGSFVEFHPVLYREMEQVGEVKLFANNRREITGITINDPESIRRLPGANAGIENLLKTLPGVNSNNELSTQYSVRGGNFDENLVYVNDIEIYRPFLIRSGQQEGLSFINPEMLRNVQFSAGGFQARYGDKMSSVLDVTYRRPVEFTASVEASLLGGSLTLEGISPNRRFLALAGMRYRDNSLFLEARETETNFKPVFADLQAYLVYTASENFEISFLGNISANDFNYKPLTTQTNFGTLEDPRSLLIYYRGQEKDRYRTYFGALKSSYKTSQNATSHFIFSAHRASEQEYYDILAQYRLERWGGETAAENPPEVGFSEGIGGQLTHARNKLQALIMNAEYRGNVKLQDQVIDYGIKFSRENIKDRISEYEIVDSAGLSVRPPLADFAKKEPYEAFEAPLEPFSSIRSFNETEINRLQAFFQWGDRFMIGDKQAWINVGLRSHSWRMINRNAKMQTILSPRLQFALKPSWEKNILFKISGGIYQQPPFYREMRDFSGNLKPNVKAQSAIHIVAGTEYSFKVLGRPSKITSEIYYKDLKNVNTYTLENVRIRYSASNDAEAYAYGMDIRWNGEFVQGTESWLSIGYLKTEENMAGRGFIARPTDQRLKFGLLFQDYVPKVPDLKMYLNMVYNTGLPGGSPAYADPYLYQSRLRDYKRADLGLSYFLTNDPEDRDEQSTFEEFSIGIEIFNLFDVQNSITNTFVRDVYTKVQYAVPNYLSPRVFNLKLGIKL